MLAQYYLSLGVSGILCFCLSQVNVVVKWLDVSSWFFGTQASFDLSYLCYKEIRVPTQKRYFHLETLSQPLARHSSQCVVDLARQRWMHSVINWIVVGRTKLTILATIDGQFITLSVHLSVYSTMHARQSVARVHLRQLILVCLTPLWSEDRIESRYTNWTGR